MVPFWKGFANVEVVAAFAGYGVFPATARLLGKATNATRERTSPELKTRDEEKKKKKPPPNFLDLGEVMWPPSPPSVGHSEGRFSCFKSDSIAEVPVRVGSSAAALWRTGFLEGL